MKGRGPISKSTQLVLTALLLHAAGLFLFAEEAASTPAAMSELARRYEHGISCPRDIGRALFWYKRAAAGGDPSAMLALGDLYREGVCVERDLTYSTGMYRRAAEAGFAPGMVRLAEAVEHREREEALRWYRQAAGRGYGPALTKLGDLLSDADWYRKAVAAEHPPAFARLAATLNGDDALPLLRRGSELGDPVAQSLYAATLEKRDPKAAADLFQRAARAGDVTAMERWARIAEQTSQEGEAQLWYRKAAQGGNARALYWVALREKDPDVARVLLKKSADRNFAPAMTRLAIDKGDSTLLRAAAAAGDSDAMLRLGMIEQAAQAGNAEALARLGRTGEAAARGHAPSLLKLGRIEEAARLGDSEALYRHGLALTDAAEGTRWIERSASKGHVAAMRELGIRYRRGAGAPADEAVAKLWLGRAAEAGDPEALYLTGAYREAAGKGYAPAMIELGNSTGDRTWFQRAAEAGYANAWTRLGELDKAAAAGDPEARMLLGDKARRPQDAYRLYVEAANAGYAPAMIRAGDCHLNARGTSRSEVDAVNWYRRAVLAGSTEAMERLKKLGKGM
jgi:TPR repeat protein